MKKINWRNSYSVVSSAAEIRLQHHPAAATLMLLLTHRICPPYNWLQDFGFPPCLSSSFWNFFCIKSHKGPRTDLHSSNISSSGWFLHQCFFARVIHGCDSIWMNNIKLAKIKYRVTLQELRIRTIWYFSVFVVSLTQSHSRCSRVWIIEDRQFSWVSELLMLRIIMPRLYWFALCKRYIKLTISLNT